MLLIVIEVLLFGQLGLGEELAQRDFRSRICGMWGISLWKYCLCDSMSCQHGKLTPFSTSLHPQPLPGCSETYPRVNPQHGVELRKGSGSSMSVFLPFPVTPMGSHQSPEAFASSSLLFASDQNLILLLIMGSESLTHNHHLH